MKPLLRILFGLMIALSVLWAPLARAEGGSGALSHDDGVASPPADAPIVLPSAVKVPALPSNFQKKDLGWMQLSYPPGLHDRVQGIVQQADDFKAKLADEFGQPVLDHVEVRITRTPEEMASLAPVGMPPPTYATGQISDVPLTK